ncbi:glycosyltransferase 52 family protein [Vibrio parahaemolyticus]|uniref:glycosyltransferase 52 family protein n=1 Tax=Vibrio parahaemolyticus TaxID=670 RepID=UPI00387B60A1|nr:glycosyltransferase 52 family protein [Vibrio parahaemolyticus]
MNLFLVTSPFQYICAVEAKAYYKTKNNILLLVEQVSELGLSQQEEIVQKSEWDYVITIPRKDRTRNLPKAIKKIRLITQDRNVEHFFHAEYNGWRTKLILKNLPIRKEVYFDDGTLTINEYEEVIRNKATYSRKRFFNDSLLRLQGIVPIGELPQSNNLELFTLFDIYEPVHPIVRNRFQELRHRYNISATRPNTNNVGFIGQGAIGHKNQKSESQYLDEIDKFCQQHEHVVYFPHRTEATELKEKIKAISNLTYHLSQYPLEIEILEKNLALSKLVGTNSTVLFTAKLIFPEMDIFYVSSNTDGYCEKNKLRNERIVQYLERAGIKEANM